MRFNRSQSICQVHNVLPEPPEAGTMVGLAIESLGRRILHGLRHKPEKGTNGWYIWAGEYSTNPDFFKPICVEHIINFLPNFELEYLELPSGYRFLIDGINYQDVWRDENLII